MSEAAELPNRRLPKIGSADSTGSGGGGMIPSASTAAVMQLAGDAQAADFDDAFSLVHTIADILFCCSVGNLKKLKAIVAESGIDLAGDQAADYDKRTALHLSADSGSVRVTRWLVEKAKAKVNAVDRFGSTPLACAARSRHTAIVQVLIKAGGKVLGSDGELMPIEDSELYAALTGFSNVNNMLHENPQLMETWEIQPEEVTITETIGSGQFGTVSKAQWRGTEVAVKQLKVDIISDPVSLEEFKTELNTMAMLHHPHTVQFLGVVLNPNRSSIITEYMDNGSLDSNFYNPVAFSKLQAVSACIDIARGMAYLHAHRPAAVIHRDLKPANLMISRSGRIKIGDFGLCRTLAHVDKRAESMKRMLRDKYKMTGETGSYRYMAPEVFRHEAYGPPVDVYAFAMIAYQCFTWRRPFESYSGVEAAQAAAINGVRPSLTGVRNKKVVKMLTQAWAPNPDMRPTFAELLSTLQDIQKEMAPVGVDLSRVSTTNATGTTIGMNGPEGCAGCAIS